MTKRKGDFRSKIDSILAEGETAAPAAGKIAGLVSPTTETKTDKIEIGKIVLPGGRNPDQDVSELLSSVRSRGVLQPLLLRPVGNRFEVVDGARRLVAAQQTGRKTVPAVVRDLSAAEARATASKDRPIVARSTRASRAAAAAGALAAGAAAAAATGGGRKVASASVASRRAAKPAAKTVTASKAKTVRTATGKPAARPPVGAAATATTPARSAAKPATEAATKPSAKAALKPAAPSRARKTAPVRPGRRAARDAGVQIFGDAAPAAAEEPVVLRPAAASAPATPASTRVSFPRLPDIEEPDARIAVASAIPIGALTQPEPRLRRSRAMAGWYGFLAVLAVASFSLTNLAINHDTTLSIETGAVAGVGLVAVVILLATGHWPVGHLRPA